MFQFIVMFLTVFLKVQSETALPQPPECEYYNNAAMCRGKSLVGITEKRYKFSDSLEVLDFSDNKVSAITEDMLLEWGLVNVIKLNFSENRISDIHEFAFSGLNELQILDLSGNVLQSLNQKLLFSINNLRILLLHKNEIFDLLPWFSDSYELIKLDLSFNKIKYIDENVFANLMNLDWLSLAYNNIMDIPSRLFKSQTNLTFLDLSGNKLKTIGSEVFESCSTLSYLSLAGNSIAEIKNDSFVGLKVLKYMNLSDNNLMNFSSDILVNQLSPIANNESVSISLEYLNLSKNKFKEFNFENFFSFLNFNEESTLMNNFTLDLSYNRFDKLDDISVNWLMNTTFAKPILVGNPWNCACSNLFEAYKILKYAMNLYCASPENLRDRDWSVMEYELHCDVTSEFEDTETTAEDNSTISVDVFDVVNSTMEINEGVRGGVTLENFFLRPTFIVLCIYTITVIVAIVVILIITHLIGEPDDEFWWEDKLAGRS